MIGLGVTLLVLGGAGLWWGLRRPLSLRSRWSVLCPALLGYAMMIAGVALIWIHEAHAATPATHPSHAQTLPAGSDSWKRPLTREARAVWGLDAPVALFAAQIQTESAWRADAHSAYAAGLSQFTRGTAADMARWYPELGPADVYNPRWAIRAMVRYDRRLWDGIGDTDSNCDHWAMTFSAYNGGPGWLARDRALCRHVAACDPARWWGHVALQTQRATWARTENRAYPLRIIVHWQPPYLDAGWAGPKVCP